MGQHFSDDLYSAVANSFVLGYESLEEMAEHSRHEAVGDGIFFFVPTLSSDLLVSFQSVRLVGVRV